jgi:hypothetical protein
MFANMAKDPNPNFAMEIFTSLKTVLFYGTKYFAILNQQQEVYAICLHCHLRLAKDNQMKAILHPMYLQNYTTLHNYWNNLHSNLIGVPISTRSTTFLALNPNDQVKNCEVRISISTGILSPQECVAYLLMKHLNFTFVANPQQFYQRTPVETKNGEIWYRIEEVWKTGHLLRHQFIDKFNRDRYMISSYCVEFQEYVLKIFVHKNITESNILVAIVTPFDKIVWLAMLISSLGLIIFYTVLFKGKSLMNALVYIPAIFVVQTNSAFANKCQKSGQIPAILLTLWMLIVSVLSWAYSGKCVEYFAIRHVPNLPKNVYDLINRTETTGPDFKIPLVSTSKPFPGGETYFKNQILAQSILFNFNNLDLLPMKNKYISVHNKILETEGVPQFQFMFDFTYKIPVRMKEEIFFT